MKCTWQSMKPGIDGVACGVDRVIAVERRADIDDAIALDGDVGDGRVAADAVEDLATTDQSSGHPRELLRPRPRSEVGVDALRESVGVPSEQRDGLAAGESIGHPTDVGDRVAQLRRAARVGR